MFKKLLDDLEKTQWLPTQKLIQIQNTGLAAVIKHHKEQSPWYKKFIEGKNTVPIITKRDIQEAGDDYFAVEIPKDNLPVTSLKTSGSTGQPLEIKSGPISGMIHSAYLIRNLLWNFKEENLRSSVIKANIEEYKEYPDWGPLYQPIIKTGPLQVMSIRTDIAEQSKLLEKFQPNILLTFPNNLRALCELWSKTGVPLKDLRYIRTLGETCPDNLKQFVKEVTGIRVIDLYSSQELGPIAIACPDSFLYHTMDENLIVEIINDKDEPCKVGEEGRVVVTDLYNKVSPLIRYEVGDYAIRGPQCPCGRGLHTIHSILGRRRNLLQHPDGKKHWPLIGFYEFGEIATVRRFQMIQHDLYNIELLIATDVALTEEQRDKFIALCTKYTSPEFKITLTNVIGDLYVPSNGKFEDFISKL